MNLAFSPRFLLRTIATVKIQYTAAFNICIPNPNKPKFLKSRNCASYSKLSQRMFCISFIYNIGLCDTCLNTKLTTWYIIISRDTCVYLTSQMVIVQIRQYVTYMLFLTLFLELET